MIKMTTNWIIFTLLLLSTHESFGDEQPFQCLNLRAEENPNIGVLLEPYKITANGSKNDLRQMLTVLSERGFRKISTLVLKQTTNAVRSAIIPAVIEFNSDMSLNNTLEQDTRTLSLYAAYSIGNTVWKNDIQKMIQNVTSVNTDAPGTIEGVIVYTKPIDAVFHLQQIRNYTVNYSRSDFPQLGVSAKNCLEALEGVPAAQAEKWDVFKHLDFIICRHFPSQTDSPEKEANAVIDYFKSTRDILERANLPINLTLIGMTGWKSKWRVDEGAVESRGLLRRFWCQIEKKSAEFNLKIHMYHAFERPPPLRNGEESNIKAPIHRMTQDLGWWLPLRDTKTDTVEFKERVNYEEAKETPWVEIITGSTAAFLILVFSLVITLLYYKLRIANSLLSAKEIEEFRNGITEARTGANDHTEDALKLPYDNSYEIPKSKFQIETATLLGKGEFGLVYKGRLEDYDKEVAFKITSPNITAASLKNMLSEIKIMIHVGKHPNVASIIGAHTGEIREGKVYIALEICELGSLEIYLRKFRQDFLQKTSADPSSLSPKELPIQEAGGSSSVRYTAGPSLMKAFTHTSPESIVSQLHKWAYDIANGMEHIASKHIIHSDLAARNILLSSDKTAKITDFGLSRRLYEYTNYTKQSQGPLPWRWMAIESLEEMNFSSKSDVWSYGITLYELFSLGLLPYPGLSWTVGFTEEIKSGLISIPQPEYATNEIYSVMKTCWEINPNSRPNFTAIKKSLSNLLQTVELNTYRRIVSLQEMPEYQYEEK